MFILFYLFSDTTTINNKDLFNISYISIQLFKQLGWELLHHDPGNVENCAHNWSVFVKIHECPECGEEFNRFDDMIECCANL